MELGVAATIETEHVHSTDQIDKVVNKWLEENADVEVLDIKIAGSLIDGEGFIEALIIYRKDF